ncbi:cilia- and flagella-associated protein 54 [Sphaeramia orbicularis]|uniref:cilia- and flagella-associated protein 54 n=1 Tax=Sphaeramia orbicularis TaxID=375764 RepID=UPI00117E258B|nr:cilia- and flagella-associated protein 54 [Sphaeramia orbicularis]
MDWPASYYGPLDKRNPVISAFKRDINSFSAVMRRAASSSTEDNSLCAKGTKTLVEIWRKYKHRIPTNLYQEYVLQIADFLFGIKLYDMALWQGYGLHLQQYTPVNITEIKDVDHLMACFFPEGLDKDQDTVRALQGCILCIFEQEKRHSVLRQKGLCKLLCVLNFIRIMMQAFQQHEHLCWHIYNGSLLIYNICRYLMTMNQSAQALEYLLWACISLEFSIPLMTTKYVPWIVTLYCAVCQCYYDNHAAVQAEKFARRALGKINELAKLEEQSGLSTTRENQMAYKEASIKLAAMIFKRAVFEGRKRPKTIVKMKSSLKDIPNAPWPSNTTERILMSLFDSSAAQFLGILEALWDSTRRPLQTVVSDEAEQQEVVLELLSAGISILSGVERGGEQKKDQLPCGSLSALTPSSTLINLAIMGENKVSHMSAVRFIKLLFHYKQSDAFTELSHEMLQALSGMEGQSFRKAELELALLYRFNSLPSSQKGREERFSVATEKQKAMSCISDELIGLADTLHKSVCGNAPELQPDKDLVLDVVLFLWDKVKLLMDKAQQQYPESRNVLEKTDNNQKWIECLSMLCEVAFAIDLAAVDCILTAEMTHRLAILLESCAKQNNQEHFPGRNETYHEGVKLQSLSVLEGSSTQLLQKVCEVVEAGLRALSKGILTLIPQDGSAVTDSAFMQKFCPSPSSSPSLFSPTPTEEEKEENEMSSKEKEQETEAKLDIKHSRHTQETCVFLLALDLHLELDIIHHRASLKLLQLNAVSESELFDRIKKNKVSKALFLMQKAFLLYNNMEPNITSKIKSLLEEACSLIEKAQLEEKKLYMSTISTNRATTENDNRGLNGEKEKPPPPPLLLSRSDHSLTFVPAPHYMEGQVYWYQLCGRAAQGHNQKVRLGDCSLPGTGNLVPAVCDKCVLKVEGLEPNQKYVFAVAAYDSQGKLLGNSIGETTFPLLASLPLPLLTTWAHLAQVAFQTEQYVIAKRACQELWSHYTYSLPGSITTKDTPAITKLHVQTLQLSSPLLHQLLFTSIFIETEIDNRQGSFYCDSFSDSGPFIWEQDARLAQCERMLVAVDLALWLNDTSAALQAVVNCYGLLAPLIFHQIICDPVIQVLTKCLIVLEENSPLKQKWTGNTSESLMHMIACITYYLSKALRVFKEHEKAAAVMDRGRKLLQEVYDAQLQISRVNNEADGSKKGDTSAKMSLQLKALRGKNKKRITSEAAPNNEISRLLTECEDLAAMYDLISTSTLKDVYHDVMKLRCKTYFTEFAALLLQRALEEEQPDLVIKWGQNIFDCLSRRDELMGLPTKRLDGNNQSKGRGGALTQKGNEPPQNKNTSPDPKKKAKQTVHPNMLQRVKTNRDMIAVENLLSLMSSMVQRSKKQKQLRKICSEEQVWKSHLNYTVAMAHLAVLYQGLNQLHGGPLIERYSQLNPLCFSMAYSGVLVRQMNSQQQHSSKSEVVSERNASPSGTKDHVIAARKGRSKEEAKVDDSATEDSGEDDEDSSQNVGQQLEIQKHTAALLLDSLNKAALHLRRAMVLAHRGSHWTTLQHICQTTWDQNCRMTILLQRTEQAESPSSITTEQLKNIFTPLLVLSADLIMDMLNRLGLWRLYDNDLTEEIESSLHFSALLDDTTKVDLRWVRTLVLHTLEQLHNSQKWENLAHFSLLFNTYTQERYASTVTPLLVHAQRKLLERIRSFGGPDVPQPHHVKTQKTTGKEVTCRSYAGCRLLSGWTPEVAQKSAIRKKSAHINQTVKDPVDLQGVELQRSMSLVCVPLDVEDTLNCYRQALERRPPCLSVFQHSQTLLLLLIAHTQPYYVTQEAPSRGPSHSASLVDFSPVIMSAPNIQPRDLTEEDYSSLDALYSLPISPDHMHTVMAACSSSIKYLRTTSHDSLKVLALHEMGNLQFFNGNTRAAHSYWSKAVDCALKSSGVLEKWDGVSLGGGSPQQILKLAGLWGCLQAAGLTAKISQYIFTSNINQRTHCCLLSAHLFKCVLCCSLAQPQSDLQYASHIIGDELLPGVDLFSEFHRIHLGTTVTGLNFICHWLFTTGYHIMLLPMLALYLHFVGTVCRDVQRTVEGKILKIRALTELGLFTEAVKEVVQLTTGTGIRLPIGHYINKHQNVRMFYSNKSLLDNTEVLEELVNCDFTPEVRTLYGSTLCLHFYLARIQLVLAISSTIYGHPQPESSEDEPCYNVNHCVNSDHTEQDRHDTEASCPKTEESKVFAITSQKETLTLERIKFLLLEASSSLLSSVTNHLTSPSCCHVDLELALQSDLLKANLYLQQGQAARSCEMAVSSLALLQSSPVIVNESKAGSEKSGFQLPHATARCEQDSNHCSLLNAVHGDCQGAVEARERIGFSLWLRCRLALVRGLTTYLPLTGVCLPGKNINEEAARGIKEGIDECELWGDLDTQALLMVEGAELDSKRGRSEDSLMLVKEAVRLVSGRPCMPPWSCITVARAALLLSELRGSESATLLKLTQTLLKNQLSIFGQSVSVAAGGFNFPGPEPNNICAPYLHMLNLTALRIGQILDHSDATEIPLSAKSSESDVKQN